MKTLFILSLSLILSSAGYTQIVPGSRTLGGSLTAQISNTDRDWFQRSYITAGVSPSYGKFISSKWLLESNSSYSYRHTKMEYDNEFSENSKTRSHRIGIGLRAMRMFPINEKLYFSLGSATSFAMDFEKSTFEDSPEINTRNLGIDAGVLPGIHYFLSPKWMVYAQYGGLTYRFNRNTDANTNNHSLVLQLSTGLGGVGFRYILAPKDKE